MPAFESRLLQSTSRAEGERRGWMMLLFKVFSSFISSVLLFVVYLLFFRDLFQLSEASALTTMFGIYLIFILGLLFFAVPFTIVIDVFVARLENVRPVVMRSLRIGIFLFCTALMGVYIVFLMKIKDSQLAMGIGALLMIGALLFSLVELGLLKMITRSRRHDSQ